MLKATKTELHELVGSFPEAMVIVDGGGKVVGCNGGMAKLFGYQSEDLIGADLSVLLPERFRESHATHLQRFYSKPTIRPMSTGMALYGCHRNGTEFPIEVSLHPFETEEGILAYAAIRDIKSNPLSLLYDTAKFSNQAKSLEEAIEYSLERVCTYVGWQVGHAYRFEENSDQLVSTRIWYLSDPKRFATFRTISEKISFDHGIGLPGRVWQTGKPAWIIDVKQDKNFPRAKLASDIGVRAGFALPVHVGSDLVAVLEFFAEQALQPDEPLLQMLAQIGLQLGHVAERVQAQETLRTAKIQAEFARVARLITMGEMAVSIAHEVNQPLSAIVTNANAGLRWLGRQPPNIEEARSALKHIVNNGVHGGNVVASIRALLKKGDRERVRLNINDLIREVMTLLHGELHHYGVSLRTQLVDDLPCVSADRIQLEQVIMNLAMNAVEAMASVTDRARVLYVRSEKQDNDCVVVTLEDTGTGINPEQMDDIFDTFFTTKSEGIGMGLSICRSVVEAHGGGITASRANLHGSVFQFFLPISEPSDHP